MHLFFHCKFVNDCEGTISSTFHFNNSTFFSFFTSHQSFPINRPRKSSLYDILHTFYQRQRCRNWNDSQLRTHEFEDANCIVSSPNLCLAEWLLHCYVMSHSTCVCFSKDIIKTGKKMIYEYLGYSFLVPFLKCFWSTLSYSCLCI